MSHMPSLVLDGSEWSAECPALCPCCSLNMRLGGPHNQSGCFGEEKSIFPTPGIDHDSLDIQPTA